MGACLVAELYVSDPGQSFLPGARGWSKQLRLPAACLRTPLVNSLREHISWRSPGVETWTCSWSVAHLCLPDIYSFYQMKWHATAELRAVHSLFNGEVQQVITSMLQTAGCPTPVGLRKVTLKQQPYVSSLAQLLEIVLLCNLDVSKDLKQSKFCCLACTFRGTGATSGSANIASARS